MGILTRVRATLLFCTVVSSGGCSMLVEVVNRKQGNQSLSENPSSPCSSLLHRLLPGEKLPKCTSEDQSRTEPFEFWTKTFGWIYFLKGVKLFTICIRKRLCQKVEAGYGGEKLRTLKQDEKA